MDLKRHLTLAAILTASLAVGLMTMRPADAADSFLAGVHAKNSVDCKGCHGMDKPDRAAASTSCLQCHGPYATLAERTGKLEVNPHKSHMGDVDCLTCHGVHAPVDESKVPCLACHGDFEFKLK